MKERIRCKIRVVKDILFKVHLRVFKGIRYKELGSIDKLFIKWLNNHLKAYLSITNEFIDLDGYELKYKNKKYTLRTIIEEMILISDKLIEYDGYDFMYVEQLRERLLNLFKVSFNHLWY